jgi:hypothetical protein
VIKDEKWENRVYQQLSYRILIPIPEQGSHPYLLVELIDVSMK